MFFFDAVWEQCWPATKQRRTITHVMMTPSMSTNCERFVCKSGNACFALKWGNSHLQCHASQARNISLQPCNIKKDYICELNWSAGSIQNHTLTAFVYLQNRPNRLLSTIRCPSCSFHAIFSRIPKSRRFIQDKKITVMKNNMCALKAGKCPSSSWRSLLEASKHCSETGKGWTTINHTKMQKHAWVLTVQKCLHSSCFQAWVLEPAICSKVSFSEPT